jgi:1-acyl-sn-glycerol-3-phosphate acyltransferase
MSQTEWSHLAGAAEPVQTPWWRVPRAVWRLVHTIAYLAWAALLIRLTFGGLSTEAKARKIQHWSHGVLIRMGVRLQVHGQFRPGAKLIVSNHVSWMDILSINATHPARFVSKSEVAHWPMVGGMVVAAGTILLERAKRRDAMRVMGLLTQTMKDGGTAAAFPEGTTGNGREVLPFHGNLLQAAIDADVPVQPVAMRYADSMHAISPAAAYVGDTSLARSLWWVAGAQGLTVHLTVLSPQRVTHADRRALAHALRTEIVDALAGR